MKNLLRFAAEKKRTEGAQAAARHDDVVHIEAMRALENAFPNRTGVFRHDFAFHAALAGLIGDLRQTLANRGIFTFEGATTTVTPTREPPNALASLTAVSTACSLKLEPSVVTNTLTSLIFASPFSVAETRTSYP